MRCDYKDDLIIEYSGGSLHITKGRDVNVVVEKRQITVNYRACLDSAVQRNSCRELRVTARDLANNTDRAFRID
jgi:hypothetical protein